MINNSKLIKWNPLEMDIKNVYFDSLIDEGDELKMSFLLESDKEFIEIYFGYHAVFYQKLIESASLKFLDDYKPEIYRGSFFLLKNSKYTEYIVEGSYKIIESKEILCFVIRHNEGVFIIISTEYPKVSLINC